MYEVKVKDNLFIAHSLNDEFFGPAKNLHGATYVIELIISSKELSDKNVVIDIGLASRLLKKCIDVYNYKNFEEDATSCKTFMSSSSLSAFIASPNAPTPGNITASAAKTSCLHDVIDTSKPTLSHMCLILNKFPIP